MTDVRSIAAVIGVFLATFAGSLALAGAASADVFGPISLVSSSAAHGGVPYEPANEATEPVISGDGNYVAFVGTFAGVEGIWRKDLRSGAVEQVAPAPGSLPSISEDGQYVSFTTNAPLVRAADHNGAPDVYRRNMAIECTPSAPGACEPCPPGDGEEGEGCPYALVSTVAGTGEAPTYEYPSPSGLEGTPGEDEPEFGSLAGWRSAMSADGRYITFETTTSSNLLGLGTTLPPFELVVRDMDTSEETLVTVEYGTNGTPVQPEENAGKLYGAVYPGGATTPKFNGELTTPYLGASISADGSTVAWMAQDVKRQSQLLSAEQENTFPQLSEPLWRRLTQPADTPPRRVSGGSDPERPGCAESGETAIKEGKFSSPVDPCSGPFGLEPARGFATNEQVEFVPQLSNDGEVVAFLTGAQELASREQDTETEEALDDLYVVNMATGKSRDEALSRLTRKDGLGTANEAIEKSDPVIDFAVSPDGTQVAFVTRRTLFQLGSLSFVSTTAARPGMVELFDADRANGTLTRVSHGYEGEDVPSEAPHNESPSTDPYEIREGSFAPSFSRDGDTLAFSSTADNLVYGDGNAASDVFLLDRTLFSLQPAVQYVSPAPEPPAVTPAWRLGASAASRGDGTVVLDVVVPGAGSLQASARSAVRSPARSAGHHRGHAALALRAVAGAGAKVATSDDGLVTVTLSLARAYSPLAARPGGLSATATVVFTASGHAPLRISLPVTFHRTAPNGSASRAHRRRAKRGRRR